MRKFLGVALLALPMLALDEQGARAQGRCLNLAGSWHIKICATGCLRVWCEPFCSSNPCCGGGGCGYGGCGDGSGAAPAYGNCGDQLAYNECHGVVPGPWYLYWPNDQHPLVMTAPQAYPGWTYENHFQTPAPVYPYWPAAVAKAPAANQSNITAAQQPAANLQPAGYYPSYWYGH